jgi:hypothetical protein
MQPARFSDAASHHALQQLARDLLDESADLPMPGGAASFAASPEGGAHLCAPAAFILSLEDIVSDGNGEVVLLNDAGLTHLAIATDASVVTRGVALDHTVATGQDVGGFEYVTFATGVTLYYPEGVELAVLPHG